MSERPTAYRDSTIIRPIAQGIESDHYTIVRPSENSEFELDVDDALDTHAIAALLGENVTGDRVQQYLDDGVWIVIPGSIEPSSICASE